MSNRNESAAEFVATVRKDHLVMMEWYNNNRSPHQDDDDHPTGTNNSTVSSSLRKLREKYGTVYPESWKQVLNWNGWKDTRKVYLQYIQEQESSSSSLLLETTAATGTSTESGQQQQQQPESVTTTTSTTLPNSKPKRKSRWGNATTTESVNTTANDSAVLATTTPTDAMQKRGRWGIASTSTDAATTTHPNEELEQLRVQLRGLNYKIENVLEEAARVDALPHDDRERSVSPPPSYVYCGRNIYIYMCVCLYVKKQ
jgi:hypothetical protein